MSGDGPDRPMPPHPGMTLAEQGTTPAGENYLIWKKDAPDGQPYLVLSSSDRPELNTPGVILTKRQLTGDEYSKLMNGTLNLSILAHRYPHDGKKKELGRKK
jgi:hypothetical protein